MPVITLMTAMPLPTNCELALFLMRAPAPSLGPIRIVAGIALLIVICVFIYVLRHLKGIEDEIVADELVPAERGPRNNMIFIACAVTFVVVCLLLFLIFKA